MSELTPDQVPGPREYDMDKMTREREDERREDNRRAWEEWHRARARGYRAMLTELAEHHEAAAERLAR